jgi:hypothetical protein
MSKRNPNTFQTEKGHMTHKRFPRQVRTHREMERINALRPKKYSGAPNDFEGSIPSIRLN